MKVSLGRPPFQVSWNVLHADRLDEWLAGYPWLSPRGPFEAWIPSTASVADSVLEGARQVLRSRTSDAPWEDVGSFGESDSDLSVQLARWAGVRVATDRELARILGASLSLRPRLFAVELTSARMLSSWRERLAGLSELTQKLKDVPLCVLFAVASDQEADLGVTRLDLAWPVNTGRQPSEDERWAAYLHERVAWHVGGRLDDAADVLGLLHEAPRGNDLTLERALDEHSVRRLARVPEAVRGKLCSSLDVLNDHHEFCVPPIVPGTGNANRPLPWLARGLLKRYPEHRQRRFLRAAVTCRPMAMGLLGRCIDLEARIKDLAIDYLVANIRIPDDKLNETEHAWKRQHGELPGVESQLVPEGHPLPDHPWEMASLGTVEVMARDLVPQVSVEVRRVRNALAHGSPVGWRAFRLVEELERKVHAATTRPRGSL